MHIVSGVTERQGCKLQGCKLQGCKLQGCKLQAAGTSGVEHCEPQAAGTSGVASIADCGRTVPSAVSEPNQNHPTPAGLAI